MWKMLSTFFFHETIFLAKQYFQFSRKEFRKTRERDPPSDFVSQWKPANYPGVSWFSQEIYIEMCIRKPLKHYFFHHKYWKENGNHPKVWLRLEKAYQWFIQQSRNWTRLWAYLCMPDLNWNRPRANLIISAEEEIHAASKEFAVCGHTVNN